MDDYTESRRRLRIADADLEAMRALYLDETQTHARTVAEKGEVEGKLKRKEEELQNKEQTILEKEREIEALKSEMAQAGGGKKDLENKLKVCRVQFLTLCCHAASVACRPLDIDPPCPFLKLLWGIGATDVTRENREDVRAGEEG